MVAQTSRQGKLPPPILLWRIAALDVWLILDGHLRLSLSGRALHPTMSLLDSYIEQRYASDTRAAQHIARQVRLQAGRVAQGKNQSAKFGKHAGASGGRG